MARNPFRGRLTNAPRRADKRQRAKNSRWMHLGAAVIGTRQKIQRCWAGHTLATTNFLFLAGYALVGLRAVLVGPLPAATQLMIDYLLRQAAFFVWHVTQWTSLDVFLFDIPRTKFQYRREFRPRVHLRIADLRDDMTAKKMTSFSISQLRQLYYQFGLREFVLAHNETDHLIGTGHWANVRENCYRLDPEELFLYMLTKCKTGMTNEKVIDMYFGGDYARWTYGYRWIIFYLDLRYRNIVGHVGLLRFLPQFERFRDAIQQYCQKDRWYHDHQGNVTWVPGLEKLPYNIFGWIDGTIDKVLVPFSGPDGDYDGAPRRAQYIDAQESVYSGWKKLHGIKLETVLLPNGISTLFGPVSARQNDRGTLNLSGLDRFLTLIQTSLPAHRRCMVFGDSIYRGFLQNITSYYRAIPPDVLTPPELKINASLRSARQPIEKNYGLTSCVQRICDSRRGYQLGKQHPYSLEQLRVCHLLINCYICFNGDQASGVNTFDCPPPTIDEYLRL